MKVKANAGRGGNLAFECSSMDLRAENDEDRALYDAGQLHWVIGVAEVGALMELPEFEQMKEQLRQFLRLTRLV